MIIGVSGKIGSGKDTVGQIIQLLDTGSHSNQVEGLIKKYKIFKNNDTNLITFDIKKYASKLKDIVCLLIGCTREQLEDQKFKEKELGEEWWKYSFGNRSTFISYLETQYTEEQREKNKVYLIKMTPRLLLQLLGTEAGRNIIHPNIWVNSLMAEYKDTTPEDRFSNITLPKWVITDVRFPNEIQAIVDKGGINIRVNRDYEVLLGPNGLRYEKQESGSYINKGETNTDAPEEFESWVAVMEYFNINNKTIINSEGSNNHPSETALDDYKDWDYVIDNNSTIEELIIKVKEILIKEKII